MSQKKLKRLRKLELGVVEKKTEEPVDGIRAILKKNWKFLLILCLGVVALYFNAMKGDFVSDDYLTIPNNPEIMSFKHGLSGSMGGLINWFLAFTFGIKSPIPFHITSLLLYLAVILTAFILVEIVLKNNLVTKISLIIFAVLPIHVEAITWIAGRPYLLNALFVLLSLNLFILFTKIENKKYLYLFLVSVFLTFMAENVRSTSLLFLLILYWVTFDNRFKKKINLRKIILILGGLTIILIIVLWPQIMNRIQTVNSGVNISDSIFYNPFFQYPTSIAKYLQLILVPIDLTLYHTMYVIPVWINWFILLNYLTAIVWFWFKDKKIFFALIFIFLATIPSMAPVKVSWLVAERYMFLGSLGMAMVIGIFLEKIWNYQKIIGVVLLSTLSFVYMVRVYFRNIDWQTNHNLWVNTCQISPNSHNAWNNIGDDYDKLAQAEPTESEKQRQYGNAIKGFAQSFVVKPNYADAYHNQANIFYKIGRLDLAKNTYEVALSYNPNLFQTYTTLIQIDLVQKDEPSLMNHLAKLQQVKPNDLQVAYITATAYAQIGKTQEAWQIADALYKQFPNISEIKNLYDSLNILNKNSGLETEKI